MAWVGGGSDVNVATCTKSSAKSNRMQKNMAEFDISVGFVAVGL